MVPSYVCAHLQSPVTLLKCFRNQSRYLARSLVFAQKFIKNTLECSGTVRVARYLAEVNFDCVKHALKLLLASLLKENLAEEVCHGMHHEFRNYFFPLKYFFQDVFYEGRRHVLTQVCLHLHLLGNPILQHLASLLVSCKNISLFNQIAATVILRSEETEIAHCRNNSIFQILTVRTSGIRTS